MDIADKGVGDVYTGAEWTEFKNEIENSIESTGLTLAGTSVQLKETLKRYALAGNFFVDSGGADALVLAVIGTYGTSAAYIDGMKCYFLANTTNTGASTVNVSGLGVKTIKKKQFTADLAADDIVAGKLYEIQYSTSTGFFNLIKVIEGGYIKDGATTGDVLTWNDTTEEWDSGADTFSSITFVDTSVINNVAIPAAWTDVDLSAVVGANACLAHCRVTGLGGAVQDIGFRTNGDTPNVGYDTLPSNYGGGTTGITLQQNYMAYITVKTDSAGKIEVKKGASGTNYSLDVIGYIK